jgi:hypothetical protein
MSKVRLQKFVGWNATEQANEFLENEEIDFVSMSSYSDSGLDAVMIAYRRRRMEKRSRESRIITNLTTNERFKKDDAKTLC